MSYQIEKATGDLVISGFETGIAPSPHMGIANMQSVNISTETGEVMCSFNRSKQSQDTGSGVITRVNTNTVSITGITLRVGTWITILVDSGTGLSGDYYYLSSGKLSQVFAQDTVNAAGSSVIVTGITAGTATFSVQSMGNPIMSTTESYFDASNNSQYRYYILDALAQVWVHDTATLANVDTPLWFLPERKPTLSGRSVSGLGILNGWLCQMLDNVIYWKSTSRLGSAFTTLSASGASSTTMTNKFHATLVGHQGKMYYTDGNFIGSVFPNTSLITGGANVQSYCSYTSSTTTGTITAVIGGSFPTLATNPITRIPAIFFTQTGGTQPSNLDSSTIYYIENAIGAKTFQVFAAASGGAAINIATGAVGTTYFNTFNPIASGGTATLTFTPQRLNLPFFETALCLAELGNTVVIGGTSNVLYPWDQVSATPGDLIPLAENNTVKMLTVNNMLYVFAGQKGNIYITNGSSASQVISVPDYCAGIAGTPATYIEPYFTWGDAMYVRGRVWFSILDQTASKAGNCGGVWSFAPTQNIFIGQDTGLALRLENQSSYGTYSGVCPVLIPSQTQTAIAPQYWSSWYSSITSPLYGIDFTDTIPTTAAVIETDLIPTGTMLSQRTLQQLEYKLSTPLASGETVAISYRQNSTDAYTSCGTAVTEGVTTLSGYFPVNFQKGQWLQLKATLTPVASSSSSFCRLKELRVR